MPLSGIWGSNPPIYRVGLSSLVNTDQLNNPNVLKSVVAAPIAPIKVIKDIPVSTSASPTVAPNEVTNVQASNIAIKIGTHNYAQVFVSFNRPVDPNYNSVQIWFHNYQNEGFAWTLMANGSDSPVSFLCELTNATVTVKVVAVSPSGVAANFANAPTASMILNGQMGAPPAPSIAQQVVAIGSPTIGWQFQFNQIQTYTPNVINGYWIYRSSTNTAPTPPTGRYKYVLNSPTAGGVYTFQDITGTTTQYYYWVSSVDSFGTESSLTSANPSGGGAPTYTYSPSAYSGSIFDNPTYAYDGNISTYAYTNSENLSEIFSGFPTGQTGLISMTLNFNHQGFLITNGASITYYFSINGGSTWTECFSASGSYSQTTTTINLGTSTTLTQVQLKATITGCGHYSGPPPYNALCIDYLYEIWVQEQT